jgi:hypothetical protein
MLLQKTSLKGLSEYPVPNVFKMVIQRQFFGHLPSAQIKLARWPKELIATKPQNWHYSFFHQIIHNTSFRLVETIYIYLLV